MDDLERIRFLERGGFVKPGVSESVEQAQEEQGRRRGIIPRRPTPTPPPPSTVEQERPTEEIPPEVRREMLLEYARTKQVPQWVREQIHVPDEIRDMGPQATEDYIKASFESTFFRHSPYAKQRLESRYQQQAQERFQELPTERQQEVMEKYPESFKQVEQKYDPLKWAKEQRAKQEAMEQVGQKTLTPGLGQVYGFGIGVLSPLYSLAKPSIKYFSYTGPQLYGYGKPVITPQQSLSASIGLSKIHFPTMWDIALEPMGRAPEGTTEQIKEFGPGFWIGGIGFEYLTFKAIGKIIVEPISSSIRYGLKGLKQSIKLSRPLFKTTTKTPIVSPVYKHPGFVRGPTTPGITTPGKPDTWFRTIGKHLTTEFKPGKPVQPTKLVWISPEKQWQLKSLLKSKEAVASLLPQRDLIYRPMLRGGITKATLMYGYSLPSYTFKGALPIAFGIGIATRLSYKQLPKLDIMFKQKFKFPQLKGPSFESARISALETEQTMLTGQFPRTDVSQVSQQIQVQSQLQELKLQSLFDTISKTIFRPGKIGKTRPGKGKKILPFPLLDGKGRPSGIGEDKPRQGYKIEIKDRFIYSGRKRFQERFSTLPIHALSKQDALSLGATIVDRSASASFRLKPVKGRPKPLKLPVSSWSSIGHKFYSSKRQRAFTERTGYRIDSPQEVQEIPGRSVFRSLKEGSRAYDIGKIFDMKTFKRSIRLF